MLNLSALPSDSPSVCMSLAGSPSVCILLSVEPFRVSVSSFGVVAG